MVGMVGIKGFFIKLKVVKNVKVIRCREACIGINVVQKNEPANLTLPRSFSIPYAFNSPVISPSSILASLGCWIAFIPSVFWSCHTISPKVRVTIRLQLYADPNRGLQQPGLAMHSGT